MDYINILNEDIINIITGKLKYKSYVNFNLLYKINHEEVFKLKYRNLYLHINYILYIDSNRLGRYKKNVWDIIYTDILHLIQLNKHENTKDKFMTNIEYLIVDELPSNKLQYINDITINILSSIRLYNQYPKFYDKIKYYGGSKNIIAVLFYFINHVHEHSNDENNIFDKMLNYIKTGDKNYLSYIIKDDFNSSEYYINIVNFTYILLKEEIELSEAFIDELINLNEKNDIESYVNRDYYYQTREYYINEEIYNDMEMFIENRLNSLKKI
jgi:hypothetical protein